MGMEVETSLECRETKGTGTGRPLAETMRQMEAAAVGDGLDFAVPAELEAGAPPEARAAPRRGAADDLVPGRKSGGTYAVLGPAVLPGSRRRAGHQYQRHAEGGPAGHAPRPTGVRAAPVDPPAGRAVERGAAPAGRTGHDALFCSAGWGVLCAAGRGSARRWLRPTWTTGAPGRQGASGCGWRRWRCPSRSSVTWNATAFRSATVTSVPRGRARTTRTSTPRSRAARRCPRPAGRSARS